jgi:hypothetical protein
MADIHRAILVKLLAARLMIANTKLAATTGKHPLVRDEDWGMRGAVPRRGSRQSL